MFVDVKALIEKDALWLILVVDESVYVEGKSSKSKECHENI